jgi:hypothetical protein
VTGCRRARRRFVPAPERDVQVERRFSFSLGEGRAGGTRRLHEEIPGQPKRPALSALSPRWSGRCRLLHAEESGEIEPLEEGLH